MNDTGWNSWQLDAIVRLNEAEQRVVSLHSGNWAHPVPVSIWIAIANTINGITWYYCNTTPPCMWFPNVSNVFGFCFCWMSCHFLAWKNNETRVAGLRLEGTWATWIARKLLQKELLIVTGQKERQGGVNSKVLDRDCQGRQIRQLDNAETGREVEMGGGFNP